MRREIIEAILKQIAEEVSEANRWHERDGGGRMNPARAVMLGHMGGIKSLVAILTSIELFNTEKDRIRGWIPTLKALTPRLDILELVDPLKEYVKE